MRRVPEPELMEDDAQARAYAEADFEQPHSLFVERFADFLRGQSLAGHLIDLGCGPADISVRIARRFPDVMIDALDGSEAMLKYAAERIEREGLGSRIRLLHGRVPAFPLSPHAYDGVVINSLLHHLHQPETLWQTIKACTRPGAPVFVMDLMRPASEADARAMVNQHAAGEPDILRHDFYHSLLAAYRPEEVRAQLDAAELVDFKMEVVSDRHFTVRGNVPR